MATELPTTNPITVTSTATLSGNKSFELSMIFRDRVGNTTQSMTGRLMDIGNITIRVDEQQIRLRIFCIIPPSFLLLCSLSLQIVQVQRFLLVRI